MLSAGWCGACTRQLSPQQRRDEIAAKASSRVECFVHQAAVRSCESTAPHVGRLDFMHAVFVVLALSSLDDDGLHPQDACSLQCLRTPVHATTAAVLEECTAALTATRQRFLPSSSCPALVLAQRENEPREEVVAHHITQEPRHNFHFRCEAALMCCACLPPFPGLSASGSV